MELKGIRVAILAENLYEDLELWYPYYRMREEGAEVVIVGSEANTTYRSKHGIGVKSQIASKDTHPVDFEAVIIPGGFSPDYMRRNAATVRFVREMYDSGKLVAAICHAGWMLISAGIVRGRKATCYHSIKDDMMNAGAEYVDKEVVRDGNIITSRFPADLPAFCREIISALKEQKVKVLQKR